MAARKVAPERSLAVLVPSAAALWDVSRNTEIPSEVGKSSQQVAYWVCQKSPDHRYEKRIEEVSRALLLGHEPCVFCNGSKHLPSDSLESRHPEFAAEWDFEHDGRLSSDVPSTWARPGRWVCSACSHRWWATIQERLSGKRCPSCRPKKRQTLVERATAGSLPYPPNNLLSVAPGVAAEWHPSKNGPLSPSHLAAASNVKVWWMCAADSRHVWEATPGNRVQRKSGCPVCSGTKAGPGANLAELHPSLAAEWDYEQNDCDPHSIRPSTHKVVSWICPKAPDHRWEMSVAARTVGGQGCLCCAFLKLSVTNSIAAFESTNELWAQDLNEASALETIAGGQTKRFWRCPLGSDHVWLSEPNRILSGRGCPFCAGKRASSTNSLESLYPGIASELDESAVEASAVLAHSHQRLRWRCSADGTHVWEAMVKARTLDSIGCPWCYTPHTSRREVELASELEQLLGGTWNARVTGSSKQIWACDYVAEELRVVVEYDGNRWHQDRGDRDTRKTTDLEEAGWLVLRVRESGLPAIGRLDVLMPSQWSTRHMAREVLARLITDGRVPASTLDGYTKRGRPLGADLAEERLLTVRKAQIQRDAAKGRAARQRRRRASHAVTPQT